jgi:hypothetical protein
MIPVKAVRKERRGLERRAKRGMVFAGTSGGFGATGDKIKADAQTIRLRLGSGLHS